jgi:hypothetical protein
MLYPAGKAQYPLYLNLLQQQKYGKEAISEPIVPNIHAIQNGVISIFMAVFCP